MARYADTCRDMQIGDIILGLKTTCWYEITDVRPTLMAFSTRAIALGPDNCGRHHIGKQWEADRWTDSKVLYQKVANPGYRALAVGDILVGKSTGAIYRVSELDDHRMQFRAKVVAHGHGECSIRIGNYTEPRDFDHGAYTLYREYGKSIIRPSTTEDQPTTTTTQENPVNSKNIQRAINDLVAEDTATAVRPIYRKIAKLVASVRIGECLVITNPKNETFGVQFYGRESEDGWCYGNGAYRQTDVSVIEGLVQWKAQDKHVRIVHLTKSGK